MLHCNGEILYTRPVRRFLPIIALACCALVPLAHAEQTDVWDFRMGQELPDGSMGLDMVQQQRDGLHVQTAGDGFLLWNTPFQHPVDVMTLRVQTAKRIDVGLLWRDTYGQLQRDFAIDISPTVKDIRLSLTDWKDWNWQTDQIGLGFPAGTDAVIESVSWTRYTAMEKLQTMWKSFWKFDSFRAYSINFLWGPLLATNPVMLHELFTRLPPVAWSVTRIFYGLIGSATLIGLVFFVFDRQGGKKILFLCTGITILTCWLVFDLRMGAELMQYALTDYRTYVKPPSAEKTFRTHGAFYTVAEHMLPIIKQYDHYVIYDMDPSPFYANLRYLTYPSIPYRSTEKPDDTKLYVVLERPDIKLVNGRLVDSKGEVLSGTGTILQAHTNGTFLFALP